MPRVIAGSTALVTGGARGIGRATAAALIAEGVRVVLTDVDEGLLQRTAAELSSDHADPVTSVVLDVTDGEAFRRVVAACGPIDILINNAGIMPLGRFLDQDPHLDDRQIDINLRGVLHGMRAVLPDMVARRRGHVVNLASTAGKIGLPDGAVYCATKHAVVGLTEAVRLEHADTGVRFTTVMPALVRTELTAGTRPMRYPPMAEVDDVAAAIIDALLHDRLEVYVPRFARLAAILPAILPRRLTEAVGRLFGADKVFEGVDPVARATYRQRISS